MKNIILLISLLFLMQFVIAATDTQSVEDTFKLNERIDYSKACWNNGSFCSASAVCNFTIYYPNKSVFIDNQQATNQVNRHNISFYAQDLGVSQVDMICCDGTSGCGSDTMYFEVTGSGYNDSVWFYIIILGLSFGLIILGFSLQDAPITILGSFGLYFIGLYILFNGIVGVQDMVTTWSTGIIILGVAAYISTRSTYELIVD